MNLLDLSRNVLCVFAFVGLLKGQSLQKDKQIFSTCKYSNEEDFEQIIRYVALEAMSSGFHHQKHDLEVKISESLIRLGDQQTNVSLVLLNYKTIISYLQEKSVHQEKNISQLQDENQKLKEIMVEYSKINKDLQNQINDIRNTTENIMRKQNLTAIEINDLKASSVYKNCTSPWIEFGLSCYQFIKRSYTWKEAQMFCQSMKSTLVEIETSEENQFLHKILQSSGGKVWTGGSDTVEEGTWIWSGSKRKLSYTNWEPSDGGGPQPNGGKSQNCLELNTFGGKETWNDRGCSYKREFICEK